MSPHNETLVAAAAAESRRSWKGAFKAWIPALPSPAPLRHPLGNTFPGVTPLFRRLPAADANSLLIDASDVSGTFF